MAQEKYPHLFVVGRSTASNYSSISKPITRPPFPTRNRATHSQRLLQEYQQIWQNVDADIQIRLASGLPTKEATYIAVRGEANMPFVTKSLENRSSGIRLLNIKEIADDNDQITTHATIVVPNHKRDYFLKKVRQYASEDTSGNTPRPKNEDLVTSIAQFELAILSSFWLDDDALIPSEAVESWCELWIRTDQADAVDSIKQSCEFLSIEIKQQQINFPERTVVLIKANALQLRELIVINPFVAELRKAKETAAFWLRLPPSEQAEWAIDLKNRLSIKDSASEVSVCILDTGINRGHILIEDSLSANDQHQFEPHWGSHDHEGHGTGMAGIVLFDDLEKALESQTEIRVKFCLESGKILPPTGNNNPDLYGHITFQVVSKAEVAAPERQRVICMAVTTDGRDYGRPTSWSATIDSIASGAEEEGDIKRLFIISAGNVDRNDWIGYPNSNISSSIQDPAQAWNALTVGAYTEKVNITDATLNEYQAIAPAGGLSPFSTTSMLWDKKKWPIKPDIVLEGGNAIINENRDFADFCDDLSSLTTYLRPTQRQFDVMRETSGATAKAAHMAAQLQATYRDAWPETIRGLMVHSAEWTEAIKNQFLNGSNKTHYSDLIRVVGYGVPNLESAIASAKSSLNLIVQDTIQPFHKVPSGTGNRITSNEMKLHELPWPKDELLALGATPVEMRITLSYFIEPGPGEIGWKDRYRYASHALRFDVNSSTKNRNEFEKRINAKARQEGEVLDNVSDTHRWLIGDTNRHLGSIHSDIWSGTAAEIATCNLVAVYPVIGWWKERAYLNRWGKTARYSLIVSLKTQVNNELIDLYAPVAVKLGVPVEVMV